MQGEEEQTLAALSVMPGIVLSTLHTFSYSHEERRPRGEIRTSVSHRKWSIWDPKPDG